MLVITLLDNNNENDSIVRIVKLVLDFYNSNRENLLS